MQKIQNPGCYDISAAGHIEAGAEHLEVPPWCREELGIEAKDEELRKLEVTEADMRQYFMVCHLRIMS